MTIMTMNFVFFPAGEKIAYTSYRSDTSSDGKTDTLDNRGIYVVTTKMKLRKMNKCCRQQIRQ